MTLSPTKQGEGEGWNVLICNWFSEEYPGGLKKEDLPGTINDYGDGVSVGQLGNVAPFESVQLMRPLGAALTNGEIGELAVM